MIKIINFLFIIMLSLSCAGLQKEKLPRMGSKQKSAINISSQYWNTLEDSLNLFLHIELPLNQFVFRKSSDHFFCDIIYTLVITNVEKNIQVYRQSWSEKITQSYYEDTRDPNTYFTVEKNITLTTGIYKLFLNVQDKDSRQNWQQNKEYELAPIHIIGPTLPIIINEKSQKIISRNIIEKTDTLWLRTQVYLQDTIPNIINYIVNRNETQIDSGNVSLSGLGIEHLYYLPIPMSQHKQGLYEIILSFHGEKRTVTFSYITKGKQYWTDDVDEIIGVMGYILPEYSEYKALKDMDESSQKEYINKFWEEKDPSPGTKENELLNQLNGRVKFANKNFSIFISGWRSDRGRIYIIYGPPKYVNESYQDQSGYNYTKWVYPNGKEFIFIDRSMSGDYSLYREIY